MYKEYKITRIKTGEEVEAFSTLEAAEKFMIMLQGQGENVKIVTDADNTNDPGDHPGIDIEGLDIEEPTADFGSELDQFNEDSGFEVDTDADELPTFE